MKTISANELANRYMLEYVNVGLSESAANAPKSYAEHLHLDFIEIQGDRRPVDEEAVERLVNSMDKIGLIIPIIVRYFPERIGQENEDDGYTLIAGAHRLAAARKLGWERIACTVFDQTMTDVQARMWEIAENLFRKELELSAIEKAEQISEWMDLAVKEGNQEEGKLRRDGAFSGGRGQEGGVRAASRALNVPETTARRAIAIAEGLSAEARAVAFQVGSGGGWRSG